MPRAKQCSSDDDRDQSPPADTELKFSDRVPPVHPNTKHFSSKTITSQVCVYIIHTYSIRKLQFRLKFDNL